MRFSIQIERRFFRGSRCSRILRRPRLAGGVKERGSSMTRPSAMKKGEWDQFERMLFGTNVSAEEIETMTKYPYIFEDMLARARARTLRLRHGRFHTLEEKLDQVRAWPGISDRFSETDFKVAVEEAHDSGRLHRFVNECPKNPLLNVAVSVHLGSDIETFLYGRDRLQDTFGEKGFSYDEPFEGEDLAERLLLLEGIKPPRNRIVVDILDFGENFNRRDGFIPKDIRSTKCAYAQVLFAAAQDPDWVRQMDYDRGVPYPLMGGYVLTLKENRPWVDNRNPSTYLPRLWFNNGGRAARLSVELRRDRCKLHSLPTLWD